MGKSPGKWIKTVLFGKKPSKSNFAKSKEKSINEKEVNVRVRAPVTVNDANPPEVTSDAVTAVHVDDDNSRSEYKEPSLGQPDGEIPVSGDECTDDPSQTRELDMLTDAERIALEEAATKTQAAFRGYLARRAFKALKGIIRLQALIRGHLVRRQAVSTLYCIVGVVKLQALVRGSKIRSSDMGLEVQKICIVKPLDGKIWVHGEDVSAGTTSLSKNAFTRKLLAPAPTVMPLRVQYDITDPNSAQIWLERWSKSCPWKPVSPPKKNTTNSRVQKKQGNSLAIDGETGRPKRSVRKVPSLYDNVSGQSTSEVEKPRRNLKKVVSHPTDSVQENPQQELEKVKRSLRKVHNPVSESSGPPQTEVTERLSQSQGKTMVSNVQELSTPNEVNLVENIKEETSMSVNEEQVTFNKPNEEEIIGELLETNKSLGSSNDDGTMVKPESFDNDKDENTPVPNGVMKAKEDSTVTENQKSSRRASLSAKQEHVEDGLQNTPKLPSYMQATQSAKAKLRAQGSPRAVQDEAEKNTPTRRHSLPSAPNGKVNSASPRTQKPLQGSGGGKIGNKSDKSLLSSRDGSGKAGQGWRR